MYYSKQTFGGYWPQKKGGKSPSSTPVYNPSINKKVGSVKKSKQIGSVE